MELKRNHFKTKQTPKDGACFYTSILEILKRNGNPIFKTAYDIQKSVVKWIYENKEKKTEMNNTVEDLITIFYNMKFDDYIINQQYYAGLKDDVLKCRWAGYPEQYALSNILKCTIHIFVIKHKKYKLIQTIKYETNTMEINILWFQSSEHYQPLFPI